MKNKIFPALMAGVLTLTVLTACGGGQAPQSEEKGSDLLAAIQAKGEIVVAMEGTWAPVSLSDNRYTMIANHTEVFFSPQRPNRQEALYFTLFYQ